MVSKIDVIGSEVGTLTWASYEASEPNVLRRVNKFGDSIYAYKRANMCDEGKKEVLKAFEFASNYPDKWARIEMQKDLVHAMLSLDFFDDAFSLAEKIEDKHRREEVKGGLASVMTCLGYPSWTNEVIDESTGSSIVIFDGVEYEKQFEQLMKAIACTKLIDDESEKNHAFVNIASTCALFNKYGLSMQCLDYISDQKIRAQAIDLLGWNVSISPYRTTSWKFTQMTDEDWVDYARVIRLLLEYKHDDVVRRMSSYGKLISRFAYDSPEKQSELFARYQNAFPENLRGEIQINVPIDYEREQNRRNKHKLTRYTSSEILEFIRNARENQNIFRRVSEFVEAVSWCNGEESLAIGKVEVRKEFEFVSNYPDKWARIHLQAKIVEIMAGLEFYSDALILASRIEDEYTSDLTKSKITSELSSDSGKSDNGKVN